MDFSNLIPKESQSPTGGNRLPTASPSGMFSLWIHPDVWMMYDAEGTPYLGPYLRQFSMTNGHNGIVAVQTPDGIVYDTGDAYTGLRAEGWIKVPHNVAGDGSYLRAHKVKGGTLLGLPALRLFPGTSHTACDHPSNQAFLKHVVAWLKSEGHPHEAPRYVLERLLADARRDQERWQNRNTPSAEVKAQKFGRIIDLLQEEMADAPVGEPQEGTPAAPPKEQAKSPAPKTRAKKATA